MKTTLALLIALTSSTASSQIPFTTTNRTASAAYDQTGPVVASNGFDYLAAWTTNTPAESAVYTVRINSNGTLQTDLARPTDPRQSPPHPTHPHAVSLTPGRDGYFLAWISDEGLNAAITDAFGSVERQVTVPQDDPLESSTLAAWNGTTFLVLSGFSGPFTATLVDNNGELIQSNIPIGDTHHQISYNALVADGAGFLVLSTKVTSSGTDLYGRRVSSAGVPGDWFLIRSMASTVSGVAAAFDGSHDLVAWGDSHGLWTLEIDPQSNAVSPSRQLFSAIVSQVGGAVWHDQQLWIGYSTFLNTESHTIAVSSDGTTSTPIDLGGSGTPQLATNGTSILSVRSGATTEPSLTGIDVIGSFLSPTAASADFVVSKSATLKQNGELASDGENLLAVWDETIPPQRQIFASRIGPLRSPFEAAGVQISAPGTNSNPAAAFNGTNYLIAWTRVDAGGVSHTVGRRFSPDGTLLDDADIVLGDGAEQTTPGITSDGTNWLVVWSRSFAETGCGNTPEFLRAYATRVSPDGLVLDPDGVAVDPSSDRNQVEPDVVWNGSNYLVAWKTYCSGFHNPTSSWIVAGTVSRDLTQIESSTITPDATAAEVSVSMPRVAFTADRTLVAWQRDYYTPLPTVEYQLFGSTGPINPRRRAVVAGPQAPPLEGKLLGVTSDSGGHLLIFTQATVPFITDAEGVFASPCGGKWLEIVSGQRDHFG